MKIRRLVDAVAGAKLCYGEPVQVGATKVIPVARVRGAGGGGFGRENKDSGGGGGGWLDAQPMGFIQVTADGARFEAIPDPERVGKTVKSLATAAATVLAVTRGVRRARGHRQLGR